MRISDWSSDVCSSDRRGDPGPSHRLYGAESRDRDDRLGPRRAGTRQHIQLHARPDRKSVVLGKSVSVRVDLVGRLIIKNNSHLIIFLFPLFSYFYSLFFFFLFLFYFFHFFFFI